MDSVRRDEGTSRSGTDELRELVVEVLERLDRDGPGALDAACAENPVLAERLRERIAALRELGLVGTPVGRHPERIGDFRLEERIGAGGMGVVYRAVQESLQRHVALKLIRPELLFQDDARERFARETSIIARLQHPGIVPIYTVGEGEDEGDLPWYAMELVTGCTLAEALAAVDVTSADALSGHDLLAAICRRGAVPAPAKPSPLFDGSWADASLRIVLQAAEALDHAHERGVLHRDIKPSNLMVTPEGRVMLVDFGLSHSEGEDSLTGTTDRVGSLPYMPPELLRDGPRAIDRRSDVYGLGVVLYELLTLHKPFEQESVPGKMAAILEGRPPRPRSHTPGLTWEAETVCLAAMEPDPKRRYATAADMARDLGNALAQRPIEARRASTVLLARRFVQRKPAAAAAMLLAMLLPTVALGLMVREAKNVGAALELAQEQRDVADSERRRAEEERDRADTERRRAEEQRDRADAERERAEEHLARSLEQEEKAYENRVRAGRAIKEMLFDVADKTLDDVPRVTEIRKELYEKARVLFNELAIDGGPLFETFRMLAVEADLERTGLLAREGKTADNEAILMRVLEDIAPLVADGYTDARRAEAIALIKLSYTKQEQGRLEESLEVRAAAEAALRALVDEFPEDGEITGTWIDTVAQGAMNDWRAGQLVGVDERLELAEHEARSLTERDPGFGRLILAYVLGWRGEWLRSIGDRPAARAQFLDSASQFDRLIADNPRNAEYRLERSVLAYSLAVDTPSADEAREQLQTAAKHIEVAVDTQPQVLRFRDQQALVYGELARLEKRSNEPGAALEPLSRAAMAREARLGLLPESPDAQYQAGTARLDLAEVLVVTGDLERAAEACDRARTLIARSLESGGDDPRRRFGLAGERMLRCELDFAAGRLVQSARDLVEAPRHLPAGAEELSILAELMSRSLDAAGRDPDPAVRSECDAAARELARALAERGVPADDARLAALRSRLEPDE
jgi:serine/threonine protein kinase